MNEFFSELDSMLKVLWEKKLSESLFIQEILNRPIAKELYAIYLIETFHYTSHNTKSQALVATRVKESTPKNIHYMKFCLTHALEECGHELMAFHDLQKLLNKPELKVTDLNKPLPATQKLIDGIYNIANESDMLARLGYSYWAEGSYGYFDQPLKILIEKLQLKPSMLTFLVAHNEIDTEHFEDIKKIMTKMVENSEQKAAITSALEDTLNMTFNMLEGIYQIYQDRDTMLNWYPILRS